MALLDGLLSPTDVKDDEDKGTFTPPPLLGEILDASFTSMYLNRGSTMGRAKSGVAEDLTERSKAMGKMIPVGVANSEYRVDKLWKGDKNGEVPGLLVQHAYDEQLEENERQRILNHKMNGWFSKVTEVVGSAIGVASDPIDTGMALLSGMGMEAVASKVLSIAGRTVSSVEVSGMLSEALTQSLTKARAGTGVLNRMDRFYAEAIGNVFSNSATEFIAAHGAKSMNQDYDLLTGLIAGGVAGIALPALFLGAGSVMKNIYKAGPKYVDGVTDMLEEGARQNLNLNKILSTVDTMIAQEQELTPELKNLVNSTFGERSGFLLNEAEDAIDLFTNIKAGVAKGEISEDAVMNFVRTAKESNIPLKRWDMNETPDFSEVNKKKLQDLFNDPKNKNGYVEPTFDKSVEYVEELAPLEAKLNSNIKLAEELKDSKLLSKIEIQELDNIKNITKESDLIAKAEEIYSLCAKG